MSPIAMQPKLPFCRAVSRVSRAANDSQSAIKGLPVVASQHW
jgi:hypothetical protein